MAKKVRLEIVTPDKLAFADDVEMVIARATDGDLGVLPGHVPLIAALKTWPVRILKDEQERQIAVTGGFIEVQTDKITILASAAELPENIDVDRAQAAKDRAEARLANPDTDVDTARAQAALRRAVMRLKIARSK